jgi:uncharacterized peroxidase-related enzyme
MNTTTATAIALSPLTTATAPEASRPVLEGIQKAFGFVPNLMATFAHSPALLKGYLALDAEWDNSSFTPVERQLVLLTVSVENQCDYCTAAHSTIAKAFLKVPADTITAIRHGYALENERQASLVNTVRELVAQRGQVSETTVARFLAAGFTRVQLLELLMGVALKTISNYLTHLNPVKLDTAFAGEK